MIAGCFLCYHPFVHSEKETYDFFLSLSCQIQVDKYHTLYKLYLVRKSRLNKHHFHLLDDAKYSDFLADHYLKI